MARTPAKFVIAATAWTSSIACAGAEPLKLEAGKPLEVICDTKAFLVAENAANATSGEIRLKFELKDANAKPQTGTWTGTAPETHTASFVQAQKEICANGCPLGVAADGQIQIWAPAPKGFDKLTEKELLVLAVIRPEKMNIKVSTFRGQAIEALEEGMCRSST